MAEAAPDLWHAPLRGMVDWRIVDEFLSARLPEGARIEYRTRFEPPARSERPRRFVDTVAAMANGGGGLILFGVEASTQDIPKDWPKLQVDELKAAAGSEDLKSRGPAK